MDDPIKSQLEETIRREPSPTRAMVRRRERAVLTIGLGLAVLLFLSLGGFREWGAPRPLALSALTFLGTLALAAAAWRIAWWRSSSMLGPPRTLLFGIVFFVPFAVLAWKLGWSALFEGATAWWPSRVGYKCFGASHLIGLPILVALLATRLHSDPVHPRAAGAALGVVAGAMSALLMDLWCPVAHPAHVLFGHVLPVILFGLIGALLGSRLLDLPRR